VRQGAAALTKSDYDDRKQEYNAHRGMETLGEDERQKNDADFSSGNSSSQRHRWHQKSHITMVCMAVEGHIERFSKISQRPNKY
jgi:hypothetical protein